MKTPSEDKIIKILTVEVGYTNFFSYNTDTKHFLCYTLPQSMSPALFDTKDDEDYPEDITLIDDGYVEKCDLDSFISIGVDDEGYTVLKKCFDMPGTISDVELTYKDGDVYSNGEKLAPLGKRGLYLDATTIFNSERDAETVWNEVGTRHAETASKIQRGTMTIEEVEDSSDAQTITHLLEAAKEVIKSKL